MNKMVGIVRTSTMKQRVSIENQIIEIKEYCKRNELHILEIIKEEGVSGSQKNRVGFDRVLKMVENKEVDGVICYYIARLGRSLVDNITMINACLESGVKLISMQEGINTDTSGGRIQAKLLSMMAEEELIGIRERIVDSIRYRKKNGLVYNGNYAYGVYSKNGMLYEDEYEMKNVRQIKNLRSRGWSWYKITKHLNENDIQTKEGGKKGWHIPQVQRAYNFHYNNDSKPSLIKY
jgi:site-specific DNA recombinase